VRGRPHRRALPSDSDSDDDPEGLLTVSLNASAPGAAAQKRPAAGAESGAAKRAKPAQQDDDDDLGWLSDSPMRD
jgi:hypothetical protein